MVEPFGITFESISNDVYRLIESSSAYQLRDLVIELKTRMRTQNELSVKYNLSISQVEAIQRKRKNGDFGEKYL